MAALESYCDFFRINMRLFNKLERLTIEAFLINALWHALKIELLSAYIRMEFNYLATEEEMNMLIDNQFIRLIIQEILSSGEYTLLGIAYYTETAEEIIQELAMGTATNPSFLLTQKILNLHRSVKPDLYQRLHQKLVELTHPEILFSAMAANGD